MTKRYTDEAQFDQTTSHFEAVVPDDAADLPYVTRYLEIGGAGTLSVLREDGTQVDIGAFPAGHRFHIRAKRVRVTGTTATAIVAYY